MRRAIDEAAVYWPEEDQGWFEESPNLAGVLGDALDDGYADADETEMQEALDNVLDSMGAAEGVSFTNALKQIEQATGQALSNPAIGRIAATALPLGTAALGTALGGPAGTAAGGALGNAAVRALAGTPSSPGSPAASAGGSSAALQGLILTQQREVPAALLRVALGEHGKKTVNGVPVASIMRLLSSVFGQAAADADELMYLDGEGADDDGESFEGYGDDRSLYTALMDAGDYELGVS